MAQGNYGTAGNPLTAVHSDRVVFTGRTSDPANTEEGDWWLRRDLSEFRFDNGSGIWNIPVFPRGAAGNGVEEVLRVHEDLEASVSRDADTSQDAGVPTPFGIVIETNEEIIETTVIVSSMTEEVTTAYLLEDDGTELENAPISGGEATFTTTLDPNTEYSIEADADGSLYSRGSISFPPFPYTGPHVDIIDGSATGGDRDDHAYNILTVETTISEGFVPVIEGTAGAFAQLGFQHDGTRYGLHDSLVESAIPASAVLHWPHDEGSGSTLAETLGTYGDQDGDINGATWVADSAWWDGHYLDYDGSDDYTQTGTWGDFGSTALNGPITIILEAAWPSGEDGFTVGMALSDSDQIFGIGLRDFITQDQQGQIGFYYRNDGDANADACVFATDNTYDDGQRHFVAIQVDGLAAPTGQIYVDTGYVATNVNQNNDKTGQDFGDDVLFGDNTTGGFQSTVDLGRVTVCNSILSESELDSIADQHGFSP